MVCSALIFFCHCCSGWTVYSLSLRFLFVPYKPNAELYVQLQFQNKIGFVVSCKWWFVTLTSTSLSKTFAQHWHGLLLSHSNRATGNFPCSLVRSRQGRRSSVDEVEHKEAELPSFCVLVYSSSRLQGGCALDRLHASECDSKGGAGLFRKTAERTGKNMSLRLKWLMTSVCHRWLVQMSFNPTQHLRLSLFKLLFFLFFFLAHMFSRSRTQTWRWVYVRTFSCPPGQQ